MSEVQQKRKKTYSTILTVAFVALVCYFVFAFVKLQFDIKTQKDNLAQINAQIELQKSDNKELEKRLNNSDLDDYVEQIARNELGYAFPDERVYYDEQLADD